MRDPFEALRASVDPAPDVDVAQIRSRARRIGRRQQVLMGGSAVAVAAVALVAVLVGTNPSRTTTDLAQREERRPTPVAAAEDRAVGANELRSDAKDVEGSNTATTGDALSPGAPVGESAGSAVKAGAPSEPLVAKVSATGRVLGGADFTLEVCNTSKESVERAFGDAQRFDFLVRRGNQTVWRWSDDRSFAQVTGMETWKAGACREWTARWDGTTSEGDPAPHGTYTVVGMLVGKSEVASEPKSFCSGVC